MSKDIKHTGMNLGQRLKENYAHKYIHKQSCTLDNQICRTKIQGWNETPIIKVMQKLWVYSKSTLTL